MIAAKLAGISYSLQGRAHDLNKPSSLHSTIPKFKHAKFIITNTRFNVNRIRELYPGVAKEKIHQIYNGIDLNRFEPVQKASGTEGPFHILSVGRLVEPKGYPYLLKALKLLKDKGIDFFCTIIGAPEPPLYLDYYLQLKKLCRTLDLEKEVFFVGALPFDQVLDRYQFADLFVLPSITAEDGSHDIIPNAVIEAMAMALPVISTTIGGLPEMIESGISGILIPSKNEQILAQTIEGLMGKADLRAILGKNARKRVEERFDISKNVKQYVELFNQ
jgi:glycosyltransferase involved in cell wall biosynthesis